MKRKFSALALAFVMVLSMVLSPLPAQAAGGSNYSVTVPSDYNPDKSYPVVFVMPEDGYNTDNSGIAANLKAAMDKGICTDMIIVRPNFDEDDDLHVVMAEIVEEVDAKYSTIESAEYRAIVGTGTGGYLAYILGLTDVEYPVAEEVLVEETEEAAVEEAAVVDEEPAAVEPEIVTLSAPKLFKSVASISGNFVQNDWYETYGDVYGYLQKIGNVSLGSFYTYIDGIVGDTWTNDEGSTNDIGQLFINFGLPASANEYTIRLLKADETAEDFQKESVSRIADRLAKAMTSGMLSGSVSLEKNAVTRDEKEVKVNYTVKVGSAFNTFGSSEEEMTVKVTALSEGVDEPATASTTVKVTAGSTATGTLTLENKVGASATSATIQLSAELFGMEAVVANANLVIVQNPVVDDAYEHIDLMGDWHFNYTGSTMLDVAALEASEYKTWPIVQPGLNDEKWDHGYGNIVNTNPSNAWFSYLLSGSGYYAKEFEITDDFDEDTYILSVGYIDDRGEAFLNGVRIGGTGIDESGNSTGEATWDKYNYYEISADLLKKGTNTVVVRAVNDYLGQGGWYDGPAGLYSKEAFDQMMAEDGTRFVNESFESEFAASAQGISGTVENEYIIYLPESYDESDKHYPTLYLLHQYNSPHTSYITDDIDKLMDIAIQEGLMNEMIVVAPNSTNDSWWRGDWMKMISEELVPLIDANYRTIDDARYRYTAGCSMGGQGAYGVALRNPDLFSGAVSFFGAFSMGNEASPNYVAKNESAEYLDYYTMYFICGNQDIYDFGDPAVELHQQLSKKGVEHEFFIENGEHDSAFYVPHFVEAMTYLKENTYVADEGIKSLLKATPSVNDGKLKVEFKALEGIEEYYNQIPDSSYTEDGTPALSIPLVVEIEQNGEVVYRTDIRDNYVDADNLSNIFEEEIISGFALGDRTLNLKEKYTVTVKAAIFDFDELTEIGSVTYNNTTEDEGGAGTGTVTPSTPSKPSTDKNDAVDTGDHAPITLYLGLAIAAVVAMAVAIKVRRRA